jgi:SAM-dependent methyltransferase
MRSYLPILADLEEVPCALCGHCEGEALLGHDSFGFPVRLVSCASCGFVYSTPRPTELFMSDFYRNRYLAFYEGCKQLTERYVRSHCLREAAVDRLIRYEDLIPRRGSVLDVGCGPGFYLHAVRTAHADATVLGIEPGSMQAQYARDVLQVALFEGQYQQFVSSSKYDLVTAFHVAEHVHDLVGFLGFLRRSVTDEGYVVIESPNLGGTWPDMGMFHIAHFYAFTPESIARLARQTGFNVLSTRTSEHGWDWSNLHVVLEPAAPLQEASLPTAFISHELKTKCRRAVRPRWLCILKSWVRLLLHYGGLGSLLDRWRLRRARSATASHVARSVVTGRA